MLTKIETSVVIGNSATFYVVDSALDELAFRIELIKKGYVVLTSDVEKTYPQVIGLSKPISLNKNDAITITSFSIGVFTACCAIVETSARDAVVSLQRILNEKK